MSKNPDDKKYEKIKNVSDREYAFEQIFKDSLADFFGLERMQVLRSFSRTSICYAPKIRDHFNAILNNKELNVPKDKKNKIDDFYSLLFDKFIDKYGERQLMDTVNDFLKSKKIYDKYDGGADAVWNNLFHKSLLGKSEYVQSRYLMSVLSASMNLDKDNHDNRNVCHFLMRVKEHNLFPILKDTLLSSDRMKNPSEKINLWQDISNFENSELKPLFAELNVVTCDKIQDDFSYVSRIRYKIDELQALNPAINSFMITSNVVNGIKNVLNTIDSDGEFSVKFDNEKCELTLFVDTRFMSTKSFNFAFKDAVINFPMDVKNYEFEDIIGKRFLKLRDVLILEEGVSKSFEELAKNDKKAIDVSYDFNLGMSGLKL